MLDDGRHYDLMHDGRVEDVAFYRACALDAGGGPVLELACGTGRVALGVAVAGVPVTGVDISEGMLARARTKAVAAGLDPAAAVWLRADCRSLSLGRRFPLVLLPFNGLQLFTDPASVHAVLASVRAHLAPGGRFAFDVTNPNPAKLITADGRRRRMASYVDPEELGEMTVDEVDGRWDPLEQVWTADWCFSWGGVRDRLRHVMRFRLFFPAELELILLSHGLAIEARYGDFGKGPLRSAGGAQIVLARAAP